MADTLWEWFIPSLLVSSVLQNTGKASVVFPKAFLREICQTKIPCILLIHYHSEKSSTPGNSRF